MTTFTLNKSKSFFDRGVVKNRLGKAAISIFGRFGARVRKVSRSSMKRKGAARKPPAKQGSKAWQKWHAEVKERPSSPAGQPPFVYSSDENASLKKILYGWDDRAESVVIGPVLLNGTGGEVPALHEHGGSVQVTEVEVAADVWRPTSIKGSDDGRKRRTRQAKYPKRPFMRPAFDKELPGLDRMWSNALEKVK